MKAIHLQTEYLTRPLGLGVATPRFYWNCQGGIKQTAYRIIARRNKEEIWDSGKVLSSSMTHIYYEGRKLASRDIVNWSVQLWDENDIPGEISESSFEIGLLEESDWCGKWISGNYKPKKGIRYPVDYFKKEFEAKKKVVKARVYATARGIYDVCINGHRIEDFILAPGVTDYRKRIQYQTYDVTEYVTAKNTLEIRLADGWFRGSVAAYGVVNTFGMQTSAMVQLELTFEDGTVQTVCTDSSWLWSDDGAIRFADLKDGEIYDAGMVPAYNKRAIEVSAPKGVKISAPDNVPVKEQERLSARLLTAFDGKKVLDFGQNIAGYLKFTVKGRKGQQLRLVCGETLDSEGHIDMTGIQEIIPKKGWSSLSLVKKLLTGKVSGETTVTPKQEIIFTCSGGNDYYKTAFAVFGFRYVQVETDLEINPDSFTAVAIYSDMEQAGNFSCSDEGVNRLLENTKWSMKGNFLDIPTDCPTRERLGWTGDAQIFFDTGAYLMNTAPFFSKWLRDMEDGQYDNGLLSAVVPYQGVEMMYKSTGSSVGWADAVYLIPYRYYKRFGDKSVLEKYWPMMKKYSDYLMNNLGMGNKKEAKNNPYNEYTYEKGVHLGEWLEPEEFRDKVYGAKAKHPEECTAYLYLAMTTIAEIAEILGEDSYKEKLEQYGNGAKMAYNALFVKTGMLDTKRQAKLVRPLALGLLDGKDKEYAQKGLKKAVENYKYKVGTGFLSTPFLLPALTEAGEVDTAYKMLANTQKPGWLAEVKEGATTIWESWEGNLSLNHYSPGAVCQWLFDTVCGIRVEGENHFVIKPVPGGELSYAEADYASIYGKVTSRWEKTENGTIFKITVPENTTADIILLDGAKQQVTCGSYTYEI